MCDAVATQLVGHEPHRFLSLTLQELSEESPRGTAVSAGLDEEVDQVPVLVHGAPQILALTVDRDEDFVQEPRIAESTLSALQPPRVIGAELPAPIHPQPDGAWMEQLARNLTDPVDGFLRTAGHLIHGRDPSTRRPTARS